MVSLQRIAIPLFYNSDKDEEFSFNFRQRREALINTDTRRFKIQTSDMGAPPGRASCIFTDHVLKKQGSMVLRKKQKREIEGGTVSLLY